VNAGPGSDLPHSTRRQLAVEFFADWRREMIEDGMTVSANTASSILAILDEEMPEALLADNYGCRRFVPHASEARP
jgi:hypothetical protein